MLFQDIRNFSIVARDLQSNGLAEERIVRILSNLMISFANGNVNNVRYWVRYHSNEMSPIVLQAANKFLG